MQLVWDHQNVLVVGLGEERSTYNKELKRKQVFFSYSKIINNSETQRIRPVNGVLFVIFYHAVLHELQINRLLMPTFNP